MISGPACPLDGCAFTAVRAFYLGLRLTRNRWVVCCLVCSGRRQPPRMGGYPFGCALLGSELPKTVQNAIRPGDLHPPNLAFLHCR
jgi:hypothetical protein